MSFLIGPGHLTVSRRLNRPSSDASSAPPRLCICRFVVSLRPLGTYGIDKGVVRAEASENRAQEYLGSYYQHQISTPCLQNSIVMMKTLSLKTNTSSPQLERRKLPPRSPGRSLISKRSKSTTGTSQESQIFLYTSI